MNTLAARKKANDNRRRLLYLQVCAYEHKLKKDIDPDSSEWLETYEKLRALEAEMDEAFMEGLQSKHELNAAV